MTGFVSSAPGKLVLFGEYAVLEGAPALVSAVNRRATVKFRSDDSGVLTLSAVPLGLKQFPVLRRGQRHADAEGEPRASLTLMVLELMLSKFPELGPLLSGGHLTIDSTAMSLAHGGAKLGVGSSAAVATALVGGIGSLLKDRPLGGREIFELAHRAHHQFQGGKGSGIDVAAASFGGTLSFSGAKGLQSPQTEISSWPSGLRWQVVGTGVSASTSQFIGALRAWRDENLNEYKNLMGDMRTLSERVSAGVEVSWVEASLHWCELLEALGDRIGAPIMSDKHREFRDLALHHGLGYKPSGAGGGDAGFFVIPPDRSLDDVHTLIKDRNIHMLPLSPDASGIQVESLERSEGQG